MSKLIHFRKPRLRFTPKGVRITRPSARIGGKVGVNISKSGYSTSVRTGIGTFSSKRHKWVPKITPAQSGERRGCFTTIIRILILPFAFIATIIKALLNLKITLPFIKERPVQVNAVLLLLILIALCFGCTIAYVIADNSLRSIGVLPTFTPTPTLTLTP